MNKNDVETMIQTAVISAFEVANRNLDEKLQKAIEAGTKIGATVGAEVGAKAAVKAIEREKKKLKEKQYDRRYHNTKLLMQHYRTLNEHYLNAVFDTKTAENASETFADIIELMDCGTYDEALYIESIKQSCIRTKVIMAHVNKMIEIYKIMCERSKRVDVKRHWRVLNAMYISEIKQTASEIALKENIDKRTVYKDIDTCIADLTTLLFGIDGIVKM